MWKKKLVWKTISVQFEAITPEDIEEEVNSQRDSFSFKATFKDPDCSASFHVVNDVELTIKRRLVKVSSDLFQPNDIKPEPREYYEEEETMSNASGLTKLEEKSPDDTGLGQRAAQSPEADAPVMRALVANNKTAKKREADDNDSSASCPSSTLPTKMARVTKTQTKAAAKVRPEPRTPSHEESFSTPQQSPSSSIRVNQEQFDELMDAATDSPTPASPPLVTSPALPPLVASPAPPLQSEAQTQAPAPPKLRISSRVKKGKTSRYDDYI